MLEIIRAGKHVDSRGVERTFTAADIQEMAATYDRNRHEAPILIGHDESKPNQGLVKAVFAVGEKLYALPHRVVTEFAEAVNAGRYPKLSARLYAPSDKANPVPGKWGIRHLAAVQIPGVKGMESPSFTEGEEEEVCIEFGEISFSGWMDSAIAQAMSGVRDFMIEEKGVEVAEKFLPRHLIEAMIAAPIQEKAAMTGVMEQSYSEVTMTAEEEARKQELDARKQELEAWAAALAKREKDLKTIEFSEFFDKLSNAGKVTPGEKPALLATMQALADSQPVEFGEGGDRKSESPLDLFKKSLENRAAIVEFKESSAGQEQVDASDAEAIARKITEHRNKRKAEGIEISFAEAARELKI
ncbi:hypothetical protein [Pseudanabaena sp. PCC 6802]|uniref:hypothetical protein n=1 Tax=Pseudanabaena sp. PCC 6802 TaxID=118173 RepID=UPI000344B172|nr:hypothetical protein [Pseudanabaena sp. PCC 6802]